MGLVVAASLTAVAATAPDLGFVLEARGTWQVASGAEAPRALVAGQSVKAGDKLLPGAPDASVTVVLLDGGRLACPSDARCAAPLGGKANDKPGVAQRLVRAISGLFSQPERYATTMSRGEELQESIGLIDKRGWSYLGGALDKLPVARYRVTLQPIDGKGVVMGESYTAEVDLSAREGMTNEVPRGPVLVETAASMQPVKDLKPGLYRISLESGSDAWILMASAKDRRSCNVAFVEAQRMAADLGKNASARATRAFLRAALDAIAGDKVK